MKLSCNFAKFIELSIIKNSKKMKKALLVLAVAGFLRCLRCQLKQQPETTTETPATETVVETAAETAAESSCN